jgi:hypothetical protein
VPVIPDNAIRSLLTACSRGSFAGGGVDKSAWSKSTRISSGTPLPTIGCRRVGQKAI